MRLVLLIMLLLFGIYLPAQQQTLYSFVNEICYQLADSSKPYFYMNEYSIAQKFDENSLAIYSQELKAYMPESEVAECLVAITQEDSKHKWNQDSLKRAKLLDVQSTHEQCRKIKNAWDEALYRFVRFYKIDTLPAEQQADAMNLPRRRNVSDFLSLSKEEHEVLYLGVPVFSPTKEYAIIEVGVERWESNSLGYDAIFKNVDGKWTLLAKVNQMDSE